MEMKELIRHCGAVAERYADTFRRLHPPLEEWLLGAIRDACESAYMRGYADGIASKENK